MEYKKSKWEIEYDNYKANKDELKTKMAAIRREQASLKEGPEYAAKKAELEELKKTAAKYARIEKNSSKIENILSFKKDLVSKTSDLLAKKDEIDSAEKTIAKCEQAITKLDDERKKAVDEVKKIEEKLKDPKLKDEDKENLQEQKQTKLKEIQENDLKFSQVANKRDEIKGKLATYDKKKIEDDLLKNEQLIAKCDLIGANLIKGRSMDEISAKLETFKFTSSKDFAKKIQAMRELYDKDKSKPEESKTDKAEEEGKTGDEEESRTDKAEEEGRTGDEEESRTDKAEEEGRTDEAPENVPKTVGRFEKFLQKHPRMANLISKIKNIFKKKEQETSQPEENKADGTQPEETKPEETKTEETRTEETKPEETKTEEARPEETKTSDDFEYAMKHLDGKDQDEVLKAITEKGTEGFRESIKVKKQEQYQRMKQGAAMGYAREYGGRYQDQDGMEK